MIFTKDGLTLKLNSVIINERVEMLARYIERIHRTIPEPLLCFVVLDGAFMFASDLLKEIGDKFLEVEIRFIKSSSYYNETNSCGEVTLDMMGNDFDDLIKGRHVLVIEDILDTGRTYKAITTRIKDFNPANITYCVLLHKNHGSCIVDIDRSNFIAGCVMNDNDFVVGYGLDYDNKFRHLKDIHTLDEEKLNQIEN